VSALIPGYEPCRECRYWLGVVTEACAAHRSLPSAAALRGLQAMRMRYTYTEGVTTPDVTAACAWLNRVKGETP
jgi:hypothetical protein